MTATQQQKRMTLGRATRSVAMRICSGQMADEGMATTLVSVHTGEAGRAWLRAQLGS